MVCYSKTPIREVLVNCIGIMGHLPCCVHPGRHVENVGIILLQGVVRQLLLQGRTQGYISEVRHLQILVIQAPWSFKWCWGMQIQVSMIILYIVS